MDFIVSSSFAMAEVQFPSLRTVPQLVPRFDPPHRHEMDSDGYWSHLPVLFIPNAVTRTNSRHSRVVSTRICRLANQQTAMSDQSSSSVWINSKILRNSKLSARIYQISLDSFWTSGTSPLFDPLYCNSMRFADAIRLFTHSSSF